MISLISIYRNLLVEVSLSDLKQQFVDTGKVSQADFSEIETAVGTKTAYATWLIKKVADKLIKSEDIYKYKDYFDIFNRRKREYSSPDINTYKTTDGLKQFVDKSVELKAAEQQDASTQKGVAKSDKYKEFYIGNVDGYNVYKLPKGRKDLYGASCELGSGTEWCTATGKARNFFDRYIDSDDLYIFTNGTDKYQFHYRDNMFMDSADQSII